MRKEGGEPPTTLFDSRLTHPPLRPLPPPSTRNDQGTSHPPAIRSSPDPTTDLEHEEDRGGGGQEEAKDQCRSDSRTERSVSSTFRPHLTEAQRLHFPDLTELDLPSTMRTHFPDPTDLLNFTLTVTPDEGVISGPPPRVPCRCLAKASIQQTFVLLTNSCDSPRNVQGRRFRLLLRHQHQLSS